MAAFDNLTVQFDPIFAFWRRIDSLEGRKPPILERHPSLTLPGLPKKACVLKTLVTIHASRFGLVIQAHGRVPVTQHFCARSPKIFHGFLPFNPERLSALGLPHLKGFRQSVGALETEEDDCAR